MEPTQTKLSLFGIKKIKFKEMRECKRNHIQSYIDEFMWRQNNKLDRTSAYEAILKLISK